MSQDRTVSRSAQHRYGAVLALTILAVLFSIVAPDTPIGRGVTVLLQGAVLLTVIATSKESQARRGAAATVVAALAIALAVLMGRSGAPRWVGAAGGAVAVAGVLTVLTRGVVRLIRDHGVGIQAVAGALTTYLLIGLEFALVIRVVAGISSVPYFAQGEHVTQSQQIYFSFTTLTTTGYGDLTPSLNMGRALAVLEMLTGQIYLVTVIGLLVGNLRRRGGDGAAVGSGS